ncbi:MAG: TolC family protein [Nitrospirota bacterium]
MKTKRTLTVTLAMLLFLSMLSSSALAEGAPEAFTLNECIAVALKQSPLIKSAEFDIEAARASFHISKGALFPRLDANAAYLKENQNIPYIPAQATNIPAKFSDEVYSWNLYLRVPVYEGGRLSRQVAVAELEKAVQQARKEFTVQDLVANLTNTFNKFLQLKELKKAYEKSVEALERQRKNTELLVRSGRTAQVELLRVEVQLAGEQQNLIKTDEAIIRTKNTLAFLMGVQASDVRDITGTFAPVAEIKQADAYELMKSRPDILALSQRTEQAKRRIAIAAGKRYPAVALIGNYGNRAGQGLHDREEVWEAGVVATINLFDAGITSSEIRREESLYKKAAEELRLAELKGKLEVDNALSSLREAENRLSVAKKAVVQSEESLRIEELKYKTGAGTITDALLAQSAMSLAQANYYQALYDQASALTEYKRSTGSIGVTQ